MNKNNGTKPFIRYLIFDKLINSQPLVSSEQKR
jgi:hypothetical protein